MSGAGDDSEFRGWASDRVNAYGLAIARLHDGVVADFTAPDRERLRRRLERDHGSDLDAMLHRAWLMGANAVRGAAIDFRICRVCGSDLFDENKGLDHSFALQAFMREFMAELKAKDVGHG